jgi:predicted lysophospholipase L1 biosynthesis ABC-type transport system permease subunit
MAGSRFQPPVWPASDLSADRLAALPVLGVAVGTDGSPAAIERARTLLETGIGNAPYMAYPLTIGESEALNDNARLSAEYRQLADVVILTSLPIAGCTLAVSVIAGLNDRRRPFALLRLTGARLGTLRRVVVLESAVPLVVGSSVAMGTGFLAAFLFLRAQLDQTLQSPGWGYYVVVAAGLLASLAVLASTLPVLTRITGAENARAE